MCKEHIGSFGPQQVNHTYFCHCEICLDTLCEHCSEEAVRKPHERIKTMVKDPVVAADSDRWAMILVEKLDRCNQNLMLNLYEILDVHAKGYIQWRRKDFTIKEMNKWSCGQNDYVMDSQPYQREELKRHQERENARLEEGREPEMSWSCKGFNPNELVPYWPDFEEEHV